MKNTNFFLGANFDIGFRSYFGQLQGQSLQLLILKGGAGSGKSSLMKRVLKYAQEKGHEVEIIACASDPDSLDAIIDHTQKFAIMDGTAPHTLDPDLAGITSHIIYTGDLWDIEKLRKKKDFAVELSRKISDSHTDATAYIRSAAALLRENMRCSESFVNKKWASEFIKKVTEEAFTDDKGVEKIRLLSAVSVGRTVVFKDTPSAICDRIYLLCDRWGAASSGILEKIRRLASENEQDFICCPCGIMDGKTEHILFPKSKVAILTKNDFLPFETGEKTDEKMLYTDFPRERHMEKRISLAKEILPLAEKCVKNAKQLHDNLEKHYVDAIDFSGMDALYDKILHHFYQHFPQNY